jgi:1-acyl-sn-glycerol-3-phosphate acyltransferase
LNFYYKKIIIKDASNIPRDEAVIFAANHQNAFLDAIVLACTNSRYNHFLVRADIFKKSWAIGLLNSLNMMPAYRMRDGWQSLGKNQQTFNRCEEILAQKNTVVIFPEGNHGDQRRLRTLSKGFSRIAFESIKKNPLRKIFIVPVGLNYTDPQGFRGSLSVYYGEPILANNYFSVDDPASATNLKDELASRLKTLITHVDDDENYPSIMMALEASAPDYLDPVDTNSRIARIEKCETLSASSKSKQNFFLYPLQIFSSIVNGIPLVLWAYLRNKLKDPVFIGSMKFVFGIFVFPIYYIVISLLVFFFAGPLIAGGVFFLLLISMLTRSRGR